MIVYECAGKANSYHTDNDRVNMSFFDIAPYKLKGKNKIFIDKMFIFTFYVFC
jgi:hypothetical protein